MRKFLIIFFGVYSCNLNAQNVGIGTANPLARLHVADSAVLFTGPDVVNPSTNSLPPVTGPGTRLMWYPQKAAFCAGYASLTTWDKDYIGVFSVAMGNVSFAKGRASVSLGENNQAWSDNSFCAGYATATFGKYGTAFGYLTSAYGIGSTAIGYNTKAIGEYSFASGYLTTAYGVNSSAFGLGTYATVDNQVALGKYNDTSNANCIFGVGNGTSSSTRSNAFSVLLNGNAGIGTSSPSLVSGFSGLHVRNTGYTQLRLESTNSSSGLELDPGGTGRQYEIQADVNSNLFVYDRGLNVYRLYMNSSGNLGIGNTNPTQALTVTGNILASGTITPSDIRLKEHIRPISNALVKLQALHGVYYEYKVAAHPELPLATGPQAGVIAQEVEAVLPEAVTTDPSGYKMVDYSKLVPLLIEGMKAQQQQLQVQQQKLEQQHLDFQRQQEKMDHLLRRIEQLEKSLKQ